MTKAEYIEENDCVASYSHLAVIEQLTDEMFASIEAAGIDPGYELARTHETLEDFDNSRANHWATKGTREEKTFAGRAGRTYTGMQTLKCHRRETLTVVDCGEFRVAIRS